MIFEKCPFPLIPNPLKLGEDYPTMQLELIVVVVTSPGALTKSAGIATWGARCNGAPSASLSSLSNEPCLFCCRKQNRRGWGSKPRSFSGEGWLGTHWAGGVVGVKAVLWTGWSTNLNHSVAWMNWGWMPWVVNRACVCLDYLVRNASPDLRRLCGQSTVFKTIPSCWPSCCTL